jgi:hypothetical protein
MIYEFPNGFFAPPQGNKFYEFEPKMNCGNTMPKKPNIRKVFVCMHLKKMMFLNKILMRQKHF